MDDLVLPSLPEWHRWDDAAAYPLDVVEPLKAQARALGLWNLCLPDLREGQPGTRLSNLEYAPRAETMGTVPWSAEVFNCNAPDSGTMALGLTEMGCPLEALRRPGLAALPPVVSAPALPAAGT